MNINHIHEEYQESSALVTGIKPVLEALRERPEQVDSVFILKGRKSRQSEEALELCRALGIRFSLVDEKTLVRLFGGISQGMAARLHSSGFASLDDLLEQGRTAPLPLLLALDQVLDPGNVGTLARTLYALGGGGLIVPRHQGAYMGGAAVKASAGTLSRLPVAKVSNLSQALDKASELGFTVYGAAAGPNSRSIHGFMPVLPAVLVLGNEEKGLRPGVAKRCDALLSVPMRRDFDSLNVAQAGAIIMGFVSAAHPD